MLSVSDKLFKSQACSLLVKKLITCFSRWLKKKKQKKVMTTFMNFKIK